MNKFDVLKVDSTRRYGQRPPNGFTLLEMCFVLATLSVLMAVVTACISIAHKTYDGVRSNKHYLASTARFEHSLRRDAALAISTPETSGVDNKKLTWNSIVGKTTYTIEQDRIRRATVSAGETSHEEWLLPPDNTPQWSIDATNSLITLKHPKSLGVGHIVVAFPKEAQQ